MKVSSAIHARRVVTPFEFPRKTGRILGILVLTDCSWRAGLIKDEELIAKFNANQSEFKSLAAWVENDPSAVGQHSFRSRMSALGVSLVVPASRTETVFEVDGNGYAVHGAMKGITHSLAPLEPLCASLDDCDVPIRTTKYREIMQNWYLFAYHD